MDDVARLPTPTDAFQAAQIANARVALQSVELDALPAAAAAQITRALAALRARPAERAMPVDVGERAHQVAEQHLEAVNEAFFAEQDGDEIGDSPAYGPYCGCETCVIREVLAAAWPVFEADAAVRIIQGAA